jgi:hypothetical protein
MSHNPRGLTACYRDCFAYFTCNGRSGTAAREYALRLRGRRQPDTNVFGYVGNLVRDPASEDRVSAAVQPESLRSSHNIARQLRLSRVLEALHTTNHGMNIYFQMIVIYGFSFANGYTLRMSSFYKIFCGLDDAYFTHESVFNVHEIHLWPVDNSSVFRERGYQVRFSVRIWVGIVGNIFLGPYI